MEQLSSKPSIFFLAVYSNDQLRDGSDEKEVDIGESASSSIEQESAEQQQQQQQQHKQFENDDGDEFIQYFYPPTFTVQDRLKHIGLVQAIQNMTNEYFSVDAAVDDGKADSEVQCIRTGKHMIFIRKITKILTIVLNVNLGFTVYQSTSSSSQLLQQQQSQSSQRNVKHQSASANSGNSSKVDFSAESVDQVLISNVLDLLNSLLRLYCGDVDSSSVLDWVNIRQFYDTMVESLLQDIVQDGTQRQIDGISFGNYKTHINMNPHQVLQFYSAFNIIQSDIEDVRQLMVVRNHVEFVWSNLSPSQSASLYYFIQFCIGNSNNINASESTTLTQRENVVYLQGEKLRLEKVQFGQFTVYLAVRGESYQSDIFGQVIHLFKPLLSQLQPLQESNGKVQCDHGFIVSADSRELKMIGKDGTADIPKGVSCRLRQLYDFTNKDHHSQSIANGNSFCEMYIKSKDDHWFGAYRNHVSINKDTVLQEDGHYRQRPIDGSVIKMVYQRKQASLTEIESSLNKLMQ
ncbi:hypothetical protein MIR68_005215 [Amoeboaphelidium protococcarum]|nr:hypothetical protein MIR68_005215 [Amoeboaphelidium protococcarum]